MLKTIISLIILLFGLFNLNAQEESNIKLKIETGVLMTSENTEWFTPFLRVEPMMKTSKNTVIGLRIGASVNTQKIENFDLEQFNLYPNNSTGFLQFLPDNSLISFVPTFNYCFNENKFHPYIGLGIGYYFLTNYTKFSRRGIATSSEDLLGASVNNKIGFLLRGGLDLGKFIIGLEFNYIPKVDVKIPNGKIIGTVDNSYIGLSIGYAIGVGKNSK